MLKKIILLLLIIVLIFNLIGCDNKIELPEGVEDEEFYKDMVKCLDLTKKTLETKNTKYVKEIEELLNKHTWEDCLPDTLIYDIIVQDFDLSDKEKDILAAHLFLYVNLKDYLNEYFYEDLYDTDVAIDTDTEQGKKLLKIIQETISVMEIDYDLDFVD